ncbi:MAG: hypothetical protein Q9218_000806 [Villophora microphyllina]
MGNTGSSVVGASPRPQKEATAPATCPVDHDARKTWLEAARKPPSLTPESPSPSAHSVPPDSTPAGEVWPKYDDRLQEGRRGEEVRPPLGTPSSVSARLKHDQARLAEQYLQAHLEANHDTVLENSSKAFERRKLGNENNGLSKLSTNRVTSTIPRAETSPSTTTPDPRSLPSSATDVTSPSFMNKSTGNWIYPSEKMFFEAMRRKSFSPSESDMPSIVPIHNAVNERAWSLIKAWELSSARLQRLNTPCGGPKLRSFSGDAGKLSPKARILGWLGYQGPFDRHDWVVERCQGGPGREVEYVIDFYKGKGEGVTFYLDVRPKLNTWEGWRMRLGKLVGLT